MRKLLKEVEEIKIKIAKKTSLIKDRIVYFADLEKKYIKLFLLNFFLIMIGVFSGALIFVNNEMNKEMVLIEPDNSRNVMLENKVREMVSGYPMESMEKSIAEEDETTAAFLVSIAKKESNWGEKSPKLDGKDCYNYWGYRAKRERMGTGGHTCFDSPKDAVKTVAKRVETLVEEKNLDTPSKMIVWKCGYSCSAHSSESVSKWISDVSYYYDKFYN